MFVPFAHLREPVALGETTVAVLPLAAMETHGPHLPLATDGIIADGILDRAAARDTGKNVVLRLPTLWLGASEEHADRPGTLGLPAEDLIAQIVAVGEGLARAGVTRVVLFNGHGGNVAAATIAALRLRTRFTMLAASAHWLDFGFPDGLTPPAATRSDVHGGWIETSVLLHLTPALVDRTMAHPQPARTPAASLFPTGPIAWGWTTGDLGGHAGYLGRPDLADSALGQALVEHAARRLCGLILEMAEAPWPV